MKLSAFTKTYSKDFSLDIPALELAAGAIHVVIGANGSGKSTMAQILAGVLPADKGLVPVPRHIEVGYMPQRSFAFRMPVAANVRLGGGGPARAERLMEALGITALAHRRAKRLSGGETARMALARVLMRPWELLILDEPTAAMDMESTILAEAVLEDYRRETGCALLLVTHSLQQARRLADRVLFMHQGRLVEEGSAEKLLSDPQKAETRRFLDFYGAP